MNQSRVSIIILNWNSIDDTAECMKYLQKINYSNYEVIIVDNGSVEPEGDLLKEKFPYIKLIKQQENLGFAGGCNIGIKKALENNIEYILLLNNDVKPDKEVLINLINTAESNSQIGLVGAKTYDYYQPDRVDFGGGKINFFKGLAKHLKLEIETEVDYLEGSCFLIKRKVIEKIGLLDENYFSYWEDTDYCFRAKKAGFLVIFQPKAQILHKISAASGGTLSPFKIYYLVRNRLIFLRKYAKSYYWLTMIPFIFMELIFNIFIYRDLKRIKAHLRGLKDGFLYKKI